MTNRDGLNGQARNPVRLPDGSHAPAPAGRAIGTDIIDPRRQVGTPRDAPMREQRLSPERFAALQHALLQLEAKGYGPEACVIGACQAAGIDPPTPFEGVNLVVDDAAKGTALPNGQENAAAKGDL